MDTRSSLGAEEKGIILAPPGIEGIRRYLERLDYVTETLRHKPEALEKKGEIIASTPTCSAYAYGKKKHPNPLTLHFYPI